MSGLVEQLAMAIYEADGRFAWVDAPDEAKADFLNYASTALAFFRDRPWNHDISAAPRGHQVTVTRKVRTADGYTDRDFTEHHVAPLWLARADSKGDAA